jgi:hypothetical protein
MRIMNPRIGIKDIDSFRKEIGMMRKNYIQKLQETKSNSLLFLSVNTIVCCSLIVSNLKAKIWKNPDNCIELSGFYRIFA